jgi:hypothetical protein
MLTPPFLKSTCFAKHSYAYAASCRVRGPQIHCSPASGCFRPRQRY